MLYMQLVLVKSKKDDFIVYTFNSLNFPKRNSNKTFNNKLYGLNRNF